MSMWAVQADSARQAVVATTAGRSAPSAGGRDRGRETGLVGLDAEDGATDMRARYTLALDLH